MSTSGLQAISIIYVGKKPTTAYVIAGSSVYSQRGTVTFSARGATISNAILAAHRLAQMVNADITSKITIERLKGKEDGRERDVPSIEVILTKKV